MTDNSTPIATDSLLENDRRNVPGKRSTLITFIGVVLVLFVLLAIAFYFVHTHFKYTMNNRYCKKRVIGFYEDEGSSEMRHTHFDKLTHIVFSHKFLIENGTIAFKNKDARFRFDNLKDIAKLYWNGMKVMISIGGDMQFSAVMASQSKRSKLADSIVTFLDEHKTDGVDLFWKWPAASDKTSYLLFVKELRQKMLKRDKKYILSVTSAPAGIPGYWPDGFDLEEMINHVDFMNIFSMDFYGPWGWQTGPAAPLYHGIAPRENFTVDYTMNYYTCKLKETSKLNIVIPMDARIWRNVKTTLPGSEVFRRADLVGGKVEGTIYTSRLVAENAGINFAPSNWDEQTKSSYIFDQKSGIFLTFENKKSIEEKLNYVNEKNLGGVWIRSVNMDDGSVHLLDDINYQEYCSSRSTDTVNYQCV
ncbi:hypothetical protein CRE_02516 [Caenorhabditis remanei]|uniref:GH18 domain-containing protein n=1 Tax=Caenorhabditis remanei TaxID=31234 RepID=E3MWP1_CAERE|nr:hypothetical protein CRE_02516 [Caenorhabditis remanei]